jgi:AraC-like DNA-binding protein
MSNLSSIIVAFTIFNCFFFSIVVWRTPSRNPRANQFGAMLLFILGIVWLRYLIPEHYPFLRYSFFLTLTPLCAAIGTLSYFFVRESTEPNHVIKSVVIRHFLPIAGFIVAGLIWLIVFPEPNLTEIHIQMLLNVYRVYVFVYFLINYKLIKRYETRLDRFLSNKRKENIRRLRKIYWCMIAIWLIWTLPQFVKVPLNLYLHFPIYCLLIYLIFFHSLRYKSAFLHLSSQNEETIKEVLSIEDEQVENTTIKPINSRIELFKYELVTFMEREKPYLDPELSLPKLAEHMNVSVHFLSQAINTSLNENFFQFINRYRIEESKKLLACDSKAHYTIVQIAYDAGFNSKTTFNTTFKKLTGISPSEFQKQAISTPQ